MQETRNVREMKDFSEVKSKNRFLSKVYLWMTLALLISGGTAFFASQSANLIQALFGNGGIGFIVLCVAEIVIVFWLSSRIRKISAMAATVGFVVYSVVNGLTLSSIFIVYKFDSIFVVFLISASLFAAMAIYGSFTKSNLNSVGRYFSMALIGVIIASVVNIFLKSSSLEWIVSMASVLIFTGLTAYDAQKFMRASESAENQSDDVFQKAAVIAALELYLDFINIFLSLLRIFGKRNN